MTRWQLIKFLQSVQNVRASADDETAVSSAIGLYPLWKVGFQYSVGDRVLYNKVLYKCLQAHFSQEEWTPEAAVSLWAEVLAGQDDTDIGEWVQPDSTNPYMTGDRVTHNGKTWESIVDNNVWEPGVYGWAEVTE